MKTYTITYEEAERVSKLISTYVSGLHTTLDMVDELLENGHVSEETEYEIFMKELKYRFEDSHEEIELSNEELNIIEGAYLELDWDDDDISNFIARALEE